MQNSTYQVVVGLEVHAQLLTQSKLFCGDSAEFGAEPNTHISPITMALPGTLPKMNSKAIEHAITLGLAMQCNIEQHNYFARKNYFYPDLPKGYQISQHTTPICKNGKLLINVNGNERFVHLNRIHIEEDAGKSLHDVNDRYTCIDLNRAGMALLEIVTEPDIHSSDEAFAYLTELRRLLRWTGVCDGNMEEGSMRCDANISIRLQGETKLGTRVEVKNLNSIRNVKRAIDIEVERLIKIVEAGQTIVQETRSYDADKNITFSLRSKEEADDYRYFPDPDLTPFHITDEYLNNIKAQLPALPQQLEQQYQQEFGLPQYDAQFICSDKALANYYQGIIAHTKNYKAASNWIMGPIKNYLNEQNIEIDEFVIAPATIAEIITLIDNGTLNFSTASTKLFNSILQHPTTSATELTASLNLSVNNDSSLLNQWIDEVLSKMPDKVKEYKSGKKGLLGLFAGEVKKISKGKADMNVVTKLLSEKLQ